MTIVKRHRYHAFTNDPKLYDYFGKNSNFQVGKKASLILSMKILNAMYGIDAKDLCYGKFVADLSFAYNLIDEWTHTCDGIHEPITYQLVTQEWESSSE